MPVPQFHARSLTELIQIRADTQGDEAAIHTGAAEFGEELMTLTYSDVFKAVNRLSTHYASQPNLLPSTSSDEIPPEQVVAVLTSTAVDESLLELALAKLGLTALLLSINNSTAAVIHLCRQTKSSHLIYGTKYAAVAADAQSTLAKEGYELGIIPEQRFPLWGKGGIQESHIPDYPARLTPDQEAKRTGVILHSSGSTGFPKPVYISHYGLIANMANSIPKTGFSALPVFHGFGHFSIFRCIYHGKTFTLMPPHLPLTSANICRIIRQSPTKPVQHFAVPYVIKLLAETEEGVETLAGFEAVTYAGAAVPDDLGDRLVQAGVPLISFFGTTETGALLNSRRDCKTDLAWNWLRVEGPIVDYIELIPQSANTFEVVVKDGWPAKIVSNRDDNAYCTKDLMLQHPVHKNWLKYIGRLDDTLTQTLGEKTNPVPIELAIRGNSPLITECIVFGDGRPQVGALILPSEAGAELSKDKKAFIDAIWPVIAEANAAAPTHSRILLEMVDVLDYGTEIPVATKMSILRPACYKKFAPLIEAIYERFEKGTGAPKRDITDQTEMQGFLIETILTALGDKSATDLLPETDLFSYGVDSLQATRIRNVISKSVELGDINLGQNIVYEHPSVSQLAAYLLKMKSGAGGAQSIEETHKTMWEMVDHFASQLIKPATTADHVANGHVGETIVLTGATGSLGAHILHQLVSSSSVSKVICLSRAKSDEDSWKRVQDSLSQRELSLSTPQSEKIQSFSADVNSPYLGLSPESYESIRTSATGIIHNAWPVNFVLSIQSFKVHIQGAVNLLNLGLSSPHKVKPAFFFSSSVGTRQGRPDPVCAEDFSDDPVTAGGMGYGQSKWVVEKVIERAGSVGARAGVLRIGQLVGDTVEGVWNETEAWPLMFRSAKIIKCLPMLDEKLSWLPVNQAGSSISQVVLATTISASSEHKTSSKVYHILNSQISAWEDVLSGLKQGGLEFEIVDRKVWLERLAKSDGDLGVNPTYKLLGLYQNRIGKKDERPFMEFDTTQTSQISETIRDCQKIDSDLVALWTKHWIKTGFLA